MLDDRSVLLGLGDVVDANGAIPKDARDQIIDALAEYGALSREAGAQRLALIGTEPLRRASNADTVAAAVLDSTGHELHVISVDQEAELTVLGVTGGRAPGHPLIVVDIGGGSTEVGIYRPGAGLEVAALPIGSARLTNSLVHNDPPTEPELDLLHDAAAEIRSQLPQISWDGHRDRLQAVFVGGTATNLARLGRLSRSGLAEDRRLIHELDSTAITAHFGVRPRRARQLAAGAAIVEVLLDHFGIDEADVSTASLRDGAIIAEWRFGDDWPERLKRALRSTCRLTVGDRQPVAQRPQRAGLAVVAAAPAGGQASGSGPRRAARTGASLLPIASCLVSDRPVRSC